MSTSLSVQVPWPQRVALLLAFAQHNADLYYTLHMRGGGHPQDIARARMCETFLAMGIALFPELDAPLGEASP